jgi:hypothetical protein
MHRCVKKHLLAFFASPPFLLQPPGPWTPLVQRTGHITGRKIQVLIPCHIISGGTWNWPIQRLCHVHGLCFLIPQGMCHIQVPRIWVPRQSDTWFTHDCGVKIGPGPGWARPAASPQSAQTLLARFCRRKCRLPKTALRSQTLKRDRKKKPMCKSGSSGPGPVERTCTRAPSQTHPRTD